jgi:hypothetical protein
MRYNTLEGIDLLSDKINNEHDLGYKRLLTHKKTFIEFLRDFVKKDWVKRRFSFNS